MSRLVKESRDTAHSRSVPEGATASPSAAPPSASSGANSPMSGNKIVKTWRVMGDRTRSKTKDILKRWQTMNNGQTSEDSLAGLDDFSDISGSTDSDRTGHRGKKGTWSVHVWSLSLDGSLVSTHETDTVDSNSWIQLTPRRRHYFGHNQKGSSITVPPAGGAAASQATWVRRPFEDDDDLQPPEGKIYLSDFQVEKFTYYFTDVFDHNKDRVITIEDIHALNERMRHYAGWSEDNEYYLTMKEIHADFFECLLEHVGKIEPEYGFEFDVDRIPDRVQMYQWLNMWGNLVHGARAMADFPIWLQILPKILFKVINRRDDGIVSYDELRSFYALFIKLPEDQVENITEEAYRALTSSGDFPLTERVYLMAFANFLLGKTPHGPGKYIFGGFKDSEVGLFQVDYSCLLEPKED